MEEQPIDKLFKRKLSEAEIKPSNSAWTTLQAKRGQTRIGFGWITMAVAASILIVCSFGWWVLKPNSKNVVVAMAGKNIHRKIENPFSFNKEKLEPKSQEQIQFNNHTDNVIAKIQTRGKIEKIQQIGFRKAKSVVAIQVARIAEVNYIEDPKVDPTGINEVVTTVPISKEPILYTSERTLVVTIDLPEQAIPTSTDMVAKVTTGTHKSGFSNLLKKVKRFKNGDELALSTEETTRTTRKGLGKFYDEVKESIKNNSIEE